MEYFTEAHLKTADDLVRNLQGYYNQVQKLTLRLCSSLDNTCGVTGQRNSLRDDIFAMAVRCNETHLRMFLSEWVSQKTLYPHAKDQFDKHRIEKVYSLTEHIVVRYIDPQRNSKPMKLTLTMEQWNRAIVDIRTWRQQMTSLAKSIDTEIRDKTKRTPLGTVYELYQLLHKRCIENYMNEVEYVVTSYKPVNLSIPQDAWDYKNYKPSKIIIKDKSPDAYDFQYVWRNETDRRNWDQHAQYAKSDEAQKLFNMWYNDEDVELIRPDPPDTLSRSDRAIKILHQKDPFEDKWQDPETESTLTSRRPRSKAVPVGASLGAAAVHASPRRPTVSVIPSDVETPAPSLSSERSNVFSGATTTAPAHKKAPPATTPQPIPSQSAAPQNVRPSMQSASGWDSSIEPLLIEQGTSPSSGNYSYTLKWGQAEYKVLWTEFLLRAPQQADALLYHWIHQSNIPMARQFYQTRSDSDNLRMVYYTRDWQIGDSRGMPKIAT